MKKDLSAMTLKELWQLFPIRLEEYNGQWPTWYRQEKERLLGLLPPEVRLHHIGSTAVSGLGAKPIIDILLEADIGRQEELKEILIAAGYICMAAGPGRLDFNRGYTPDGFAERVFHLHLRSCGDNDELYFRDYLRQHPEVRLAYEKLKLSLARPFEQDRDGYTEAKTAFVQRYTALALEKYGRIYGVRPATDTDQGE